MKVSMTSIVEFQGAEVTYSRFLSKIYYGDSISLLWLAEFNLYESTKLKHMFRKQTNLLMDKLENNSSDMKWLLIIKMYRFEITTDKDTKSLQNLIPKIRFMPF